MTWTDELDGQTWRQRSRLAQERLGLSDSVEATLADGSSKEDERIDELDGEPNSHPGYQSRNTALIPPRLSLQSRALTVISSDMPSESPSSVEPVTEEQNVNLLVRLAHRITSSLSSLLISSEAEAGRRDPIYDLQTIGQKADGFPFPPAPQISYGLPMMYESSFVLPAAYSERNASSEPPTSTIIESLPLSSPMEVQSTPQPKLEQRLAGRSTKVRLEAVAHPEGRSREQEEKHTTALNLRSLPHSSEPAKEKNHGFIKMNADLNKEHIESQALAAFYGSGALERGQSEVAIAHPQITPSSVVVVTLISDPGPVVVQYITLRPEEGFTVHVSAPTTAKTPFNYVILNRD